MRAVVRNMKKVRELLQQWEGFFFFLLFRTVLPDSSCDLFCSAEPRPPQRYRVWKAQRMVVETVSDYSTDQCMSVYCGVLFYAVTVLFLYIHAFIKDSVIVFLFRVCVHIISKSLHVRVLMCYCTN